MASSDDLTAMIRDLGEGRFGLAETVEYLHAKALLLRTAAIKGLQIHARTAASAVNHLADAARDPKNNGNDARLLGLTTVAHVAVAALLMIGTPDAREMAKALVEERDVPERDDLLWYLRSEGLSPKE